jgi:hypothetical protein
MAPSELDRSGVVLFSPMLFWEGHLREDINVDYRGGKRL